MAIPVFQVDAFTNKPFKGNPAVVCFIEEPKTDEWHQSVAEEMNVSETAFLMKENDGWRLRWFTPTVEVKLCGHATLASAHILFETGRQAKSDTIHFFTLSGELTAKFTKDGIELDFPEKSEMHTEEYPELTTILNIPITYIGKSQYDVLVEVESEKDVRNLKPDIKAIASLDFRGLMVTAKSDNPEFDFVSRFFAPAVGVNEDPVTGSAHCCLAPYWMKKTGKSDMVGYQASSRGGIVKVKVEGDRVKLIGDAITVASGELFY